ncbi:tetraacyldisaccharide 4'-kinase [Myroides odoratimimus]|uniref:tetraacyldisaccharide 4'-kinase n=1 Tax=Myroides odoratimimus TaxID=76832 RepID=UPI002DBA5C9B|nr:tetraacyldisaccharide 4'-kinase [Myroides odoratimimus]MEC4044008.1 tetraacyldisaccharide 4'-kinase [Myroides odoratimimus]MEC4151838.1 tetraacyldisaccharide 4'-kinase [Myroides odoratimimus]
MELLRKLLFPFAILYGGITSLRNYLYSINILKRTSFSTPTIVVGNLSVGGTGKTPMVEYIIRLLKDKYKIATLSRGYKRKSEGFFLADEHTTMEQIGDEPFQYHHKFDNIAVAVDAKRVNGIENILKRRTDTQAIVLDDAFQHLAVKGGFNILLTTYDEPYYSDYMLPTGNLRESRRGAKRADIIIVTKCPPTLSSTEQNSIVKKLNLKLGQLSFFTYIEFSKLAYSKADSISVEDLKKEEFLMVAGIAKPQSFFDHLKGDKTICLTFPDHHHFSSTDIELILNKAKENKIITTEKDYVRLNGLIPSNKLYYLPIQTSFLNNQEEFDKTILNYVGASTRNG